MERETRTSGFGACHAAPEQLEELVGVELDTLFAHAKGGREGWLPFEYPIWDLAGHRSGQPVYALAAAITGKGVSASLTAPCYDSARPAITSDHRTPR